MADPRGVEPNACVILSPQRSIISPPLSSPNSISDKAEVSENKNASSYINPVSGSLGNKEDIQPSNSSVLLSQSKKIQKKKTQSQKKQLLSNDVDHGSKEKRTIWTVAEDQQVLDLAEEFKFKWTQIGQIVGKTGKQVRDRYLNVLKPGINNEGWTEEEEKLLIQLESELGRKWCNIAARMSGRTEKQVKNKFYKLIKGKATEKPNSIKNYNREKDHFDEDQTEKIEDVIDSKNYKNKSRDDSLIEKEEQESDEKKLDEKDFSFPSSHTSKTTASEEDNDIDCFFHF